MRIIDLSLPIDDSVSETHPVEIERWEHRSGGDRLGKLWARSQGIKGRMKHITGKERITRDCFKDGLFLSLEWVRATVHSGTHLDAPYHYGPYSEGKPAKKIEDIPLEWCYGDGVVLDCSDKGAGEVITEADIKKALGKIKYKIKPFDIVLIHTGADKLWGTKKYFSHYVALSRDALAYIVNFGVKVIGVDIFSLDRPLPAMVRDFLKTKDNSYLWPVHFYGREKEYCHIERLANLDKIPQPYGFKVACFPIKIKGAGAAWVRAVAIIE